MSFTPFSAYHARYADILSYAATWSLVTGTANSAFPLTNLTDVRADVVSKLTGTSGKYRGTIASTALQAIGIINTNAAGSTLVITNNNAMASQNLVVPALPADSLGLNALIDLRAVTTAATEWNVEFPAQSGNVAVGKILLISNLRNFLIRWHPRIAETSLAIRKRTTSGVMVGYPRGTRYRAWTVQLLRESERSAYTSLRRGSVGPSQPCVVWPESTSVDCVYGFFADDTWSHEREQASVTTWTDTIEEMNPGVSL